MAYTAELKAVVPEFEDWRLLCEEDQITSEIPHIVQLITAVALNVNGPSCVFVLPQAEQIAYLVALFTALIDTKRNFVERQTAFVKNGLQVGQNVMLLPQGEIYQYDGYFEDLTPPKPKCKIVVGSNKGGRFSLDQREIMRLVPTRRKQPGGKKAPSPKVQCPLSDLDNLLQISSYGNPAVFSNKVIIQGVRQSLEDFFSLWDIAIRDGKIHLKDLNDLPWGSIDSSGKISSTDRYQAAGEPLIVLSSRLSPIGGYCSEQPEKTKTLISCNKRSIIEDSFDASSVVSRQKLLLLTNSLDEAEYDELRNRGVEIWKPSRDELTSGLSTLDASKPIKHFLIAAVPDEDRVSLTHADSAPFRRVLENLTSLKRGVEDKDANKAIMGAFNRVLWGCSELLALPSENYQKHTLQQIAEVKSILRDQASFIRKELMDIAGETAEILINDIASNIETSSESKFSRLKEKIVSNLGPLLVLVRHEEAAATVVKRLAIENEKVKVLTYAGLRLFSLSKQEPFEKVLIIGWPGRQLFQDMLESGIAPKVEAILYDHEMKVANAFFRDRKKTDIKMSLPAEVKSAITSLPQNAFSEPEPSAIKNSTEEKDAGDDTGYEEQRALFTPDILALEAYARSTGATSQHDLRKVKARYLSLSDDMCMYVTEDCAVPVITPSKNHEYKRKTADAFVTGDIIVSRGYGGRDLLREVAVYMYGDRYEQLRSLATSWKHWLSMLGENPIQIWESLLTCGLKRHPITVSGWLNNEDLIGPLNLKDIEMIAKATDSKDIIAQAPRVAAAIRKLKGVHIKAGYALTDIVMKNLSTINPAESNDAAGLANKLADVRIFSIENIDGEYRDIPAHLANTPLSLLEIKQQQQIDKAAETILANLGLNLHVSGQR